jgi:mRNA interferase MazF
VNQLDSPSVVATTIIQTLAWKERKAKFIVKAEKNIFNAVLKRILPLIGAEKLYAQ